MRASERISILLLQLMKESLNDVKSSNSWPIAILDQIFLLLSHSSPQNIKNFTRGLIQIQPHLEKESCDNCPLWEKNSNLQLQYKYYQQKRNIEEVVSMINNYSVLNNLEGNSDPSESMEIQPWSSSRIHRITAQMKTRISNPKDPKTKNAIFSLSNKNSK